MHLNLINMFDLINCLSDTGDMINSDITNHHKKVAYLAYKIAEGFGMTRDQQRDILMAGLLHDLGAFSPRERIELLDRETPDVHRHAFIGAGMLRSFQPLKAAADIIKYHHIPWDYGKGQACGGEDVPLSSHIIHLADRVVVQIDGNKGIMQQIPAINDNVRGRVGSVFMPELVDVYLSLSSREYIWLDIVYEPLMAIMPNLMSFEFTEMTIDEAIPLTEIFAQIIDFRSPFTARHSSGVAAVAEKLAKLVGFSAKECKMMRIAGYLHDLGKLAVGQEIIEKTGKLDPEEQSIIRSHSFYTYRTLQRIKEFETINTWASLHHERLNGEGYPFHLKADDIPLGSRIMAVADIFTAITEDRPYRAGMPRDQVVKEMDALAASACICPKVNAVVHEHYDLLNEVRVRAQNAAAHKYQKLNSLQYPRAL